MQTAVSAIEFMQSFRSKCEYLDSQMAAGLEKGSDDWHKSCADLASNLLISKEFIEPLSMPQGTELNKLLGATTSWAPQQRRDLFDLIKSKTVTTTTQVKATTSLW